MAFKNWNPVVASGINWPAKTLLVSGTPAIDTSISGIQNATGINQIIAARNRKNAILGNGVTIINPLSPPPPVSAEPALSGLGVGGPALKTTITQAKIGQWRLSLDTFSPNFIAANEIGNEGGGIFIARGTGTVSGKVGLDGASSPSIWRSNHTFAISQPANLYVSTQSINPIGIYQIPGTYSDWDFTGLFLGTFISVQSNVYVDTGIEIQPGTWTLFFYAINEELPQFQTFFTFQVG